MPSEHPNTMEFVGSPQFLRPFSLPCISYKPYALLHNELRFIEERVAF